MKVSKVMSENVGVCGPNDSLPRAIQVMWEKDCGIVPIVAKDEVIGVVTDRDIAIFVATQNRLPDQILLGELIGGPVVSCLETDSVSKVLKKMCKHGIRRLPVVEKKGRLKGIISIADVLAASNKKNDLQKQAMRAVTELSKPRKIVLHEKTD